MTTTDDLRAQAAELLARADAADNQQLTQADVTRLTKERKYDEINAARDAGRLDELLGVPRDQIDLLTRARTGRINADDAAALNKIRRHDLVVAARADDRIDGMNAADPIPTQEG